MKISNKQLAQALYDLTDNKNEEEVKQSIESFVKKLQKTHKLKEAEDIIKKFEIIWDKKKGIIQAEIISARPLKDTDLEKIKHFIKKKYQAKKVILKNEINPSIKGGFILKTREEILDASVKARFKKLDKTIRNS